MYKGTYKIAGQVIEIESIYRNVQELCAEYRCEENCDFTVCTSEKDIEYEKSRNEQCKGLDGSNEDAFRKGYLETLAVYRKIANRMLEYNTILFHGSAIAVDGEAYLFTATSGTGKSTHTRLWKEWLGERAVMVNDDKPLIKIEDEGVYVCGTPWDGKHRLSNNIMVLLKSICILERGTENHIEKISDKEALLMIMQQSFHPQKKEDCLKFLTLLDSLMKKVKFYRLQCNISLEAAKISYNGLHGEDS